MTSGQSALKPIEPVGGLALPILLGLCTPAWAVEGEEPPCGCPPQPTHNGEGHLKGSFHLVDGTGLHWRTRDPFPWGATIITYVPWPAPGALYSLNIGRVTDTDYCPDGTPVYSGGGIGSWSHSGIPGGWNPRTGSEPGPPEQFTIFSLRFDTPADDTSGIRQVTAQGKILNVAPEVRDRCDVEDVPRTFQAVANLCDIASHEAAPSPARSRLPDQTVTSESLQMEPLPSDWASRHLWRLLDCQGGQATGEIVTSAPLLSEADLPPQPPPSSPSGTAGASSAPASETPTAATRRTRSAPRAGSRSSTPARGGRGAGVG